MLTEDLTKTTQISVNITNNLASSPKMLIELKCQLRFWQDGKWQDSKPRVWILRAASGADSEVLAWKFHSQIFVKFFWPRFFAEVCGDVRSFAEIRTHG